MRKNLVVYVLNVFLFINGFSQSTLFDFDWCFYRGGVQGAQMPGFDDAKRQTSRDTKFMAAWRAAYQPGILKAVGYVNGKQVTSSQLQTAKQVSKIKLSADRSVIKADGRT